MNGFLRHKVRRTTLISVGLAALLTGLFLSRYGVEIKAWYLILVPFLGLVAYRRSVLAILGGISIGLLIGLARGNAVYLQVARYNTIYNRVLEFRGTVYDDTSYNTDRDQTVFHLNGLTVGPMSLPGRIQVSVRGDKKFTRGDRLIVVGKLRPSMGTARQGTILATRTVAVARNDSALEKVRARFFYSTHHTLPEPQASIGLGYLIGLRVSIPKTISDQLALVGLTHIVAVSGYNLTIIVQAVRRVLGKRSAYQSLVFSFLLISGFLMMAGGSAPINRAVVVSLFSLLAWYYGRVFKPVLLLLLSGALTAFASPLYVWGDPGWYLSFLAFSGILVLGPLIIQTFFRVREPGVVVAILIETVAAQMCTIPYTLYLFGGISIIAPLANVLILPLIPFIMLMVFITGMVGMVLPNVASLIAITPASLLTLQLWIIERLSKVSWAHADMQITMLMMIALFSLILGVVFFLKLLNRGKPTTAWEGDLI